jgi:hypothetical protein
MKEAFRSIKERNSFACDCGQTMEIVIVSAPNIPREMLRHFDNGLGCYVEDRAHRKRLMKERGLREAGDPGEPMTKELAEIRRRDVEENHKGR